MFKTIEPMALQQRLFTIFVLLVFGVSSVEIVSEFLEGESLSSMGDDLAWFALSATVLALFIIEHIVQQQALTELRGQLNKARGQLAKLDGTSKILASQFRDLVQKQFQAWNLTASEQDVVLGLLKGLSFKEIAMLRDTHEKTVRQQASSVYRKAGVSGRNELSAWFFEDMLVPLPTG